MVGCFIVFWYINLSYLLVRYGWEGKGIKVIVFLCNLGKMNV